MIAPVRNNTFMAEFLATKVLPLVDSGSIEFLLDFEYAVKTSLSGHEFEDGVNDKSAAKLTLESRRFEPGNNFEV